LKDEVSLLSEAREEGLLEGIGLAFEIKFGEQELELLRDIREIHDCDRLRELSQMMKQEVSFDPPAERYL